MVSSEPLIVRLDGAKGPLLWLVWLQTVWHGDTIQMPPADILDLVAAGFCNIRL